MSEADDLALPPDLTALLCSTEPTGQRHDRDILMKYILRLSVAQDWDSAVLEWVPFAIEWSDEPRRCPCQHYPIRELCFIRNVRNGNLTWLGNVCVKDFMGIDVDPIKDCLKRIAVDLSKPMNPLTAKLFYDNKELTEWEFGFLIDTSRKRGTSLTPAQLATRRRINRQVIESVRTSGSGLLDASVLTANWPFLISRERAEELRETEPHKLTPRTLMYLNSFAEAKEAG